MKRNEVDINKVTPMMRQYLEIKKENEDVILFFRLGDFYEMFFEDAVTVSRELELTLTGKNAGLEERIPMCGIPHHAANIYIDKLVDKGYKVAICEQMEDPKLAKGIVKRDITQIISKGTIVNQESLIEYENNYIGNIVDFSHAYGISYADISTGEIYVFLMDHNPTKVVTEMVSLGLKEVIMTSKVDKTILSLLKNQFKLTVTVEDEIASLPEYERLYEDLGDIRHVETLKHLLTYINKTQKRSLSHLQKAIVRENK